MPLAAHDDASILEAARELVDALRARGWMLATAESYPNQAFRYGDNAWAIQFHAELTRVMMQRWVVKGAHRFSLPGAQEGHHHLDGRMMFDAPLLDWLRGFLALIFDRCQP